MTDSPTPPSNEAGNVPAWHTSYPIYDAAQVRAKVLLEINRRMQYCACYANLQEASRQLGELSKFVYSLDARGSGRATWEGDVTHGLAVRALTVYHGAIAGGWPHESVSAMRKALAAVVEAPAYRAPTPSGPAATAGGSALHAALAERDANAQTAKAMSKLHDEAEKEIEGLHATIARLTRDKDHLLTKEDGEYIRERLREAVKAEAGQGVTEAEVEAAVTAEYEHWRTVRNPTIQSRVRAIIVAALAVRGGK